MPAFICDMVFRMLFQCQHISSFQIKWLWLRLPHMLWLGLCFAYNSCECFAHKIYSMAVSHFIFASIQTQRHDFLRFEHVGHWHNHWLALLAHVLATFVSIIRLFNCIFYRNHQNGYLWLMVAMYLCVWMFVSLFDGSMVRCPTPVVHSPSKNVHIER